MNVGTARPRATRTTRRVALAALAVACALVSSACVKLPGVGGPAPPEEAPGQQLWRSDGYGMIWALEGDRLTGYQTTSISCIKSDTMTRTGSVDGTGAQGFGEDGAVEVTLRVGGDGRAVYHEVGTVSDVDLLPVSSMPATCGEKLAKDPETTFDVFWQTVEENYNSLNRRNADWAEMRDRYRSEIDEDTENKELFGILRSMLEPLGDMHTGLTGSGDREFEGKRVGTAEIDAKKTDRATDAFLTTQGAAGAMTFGNGKLVYTDLPGGRGYLRIGAFERLKRNDAWAANEAEVKRMLDTVFTPARVAGLRMLVIDVRNNPGGADALGIEIAGRLTDRPYLAYTKAARNDPNDPAKHARPQEVRVAPSSGARYTGPIRMLTGPLTISAGETFTLAMMGRTPAPERFGENTQGVYSDTLDRKLPNGWTVTLGNEDFTAPDGRSYEGPGIPPTTPMPVYPPAELAADQDSVLAAALR